MSHTEAMSQHRVFITNIHFAISKQVLKDLLAKHCQLTDVPMQVIRKPMGHLTGMCSAIFTVPKASWVPWCCEILNHLPAHELENILAPGAWSLQAKQAYIIGGKPVPKRSSAPCNPVWPPLPPGPPPGYDPTQSLQHTCADAVIDLHFKKCFSRHMLFLLQL
jgi:hypothetical protein